MPESFLERVRQAAGAPVLPDLTELDLSNDLHVDRAASALLQRFQAADDVAAFRLLLELTADRLAALAEEAAREQGLAEPADALVAAFVEGLFVDVSPAAGPGSFLARAAAAMRTEAETLVRDIALSDIALDGHHHHGARLDGHAAKARKARKARKEDIQRATRVCFHRLALPYRRALRAKEVEGLAPPAIAQRLAMTPQDAEALIEEAETALAAALERALGGDAP